MSFSLREAYLPFDFSALMAEIPEMRDVPEGKVAERTARGYMLLLAEVEGRAVGFKLGYPLGDGVFYSWLGGVHPDHRGGGVARALLRRQEMLARERGYRTIRVKTMNRFPGMLRLLVGEAYQIVDLERAHDGGPDVKIVFEKALG